MDIREFAIKYHGLVIQPHQQEWLDFIQNAGKRCILLAPRGHGKSTTINQVYLSWVIANNPSIRALFISHSKEMAESFSRTIRNIMESPELQAEFGFTNGVPWRANSWRLEQSPQSKPTLECKGAMGRMAGWRGDMVIFDDLLESTMVVSESTMRKVEDWIKTDVLPAINPSPLEKVVVVGTRKHINDWYGKLLNNKTYKQRTDKAWNPRNLRPLWPWLLDEHGEKVVPMYNREVLEAKREEIGALKFAQEYLNEPSPPEGLLFRYEWLKFFEHLPDHTHMEYFIGIDPSHGSKRERASYYAICVIAYDRIYDKIYVVEFYRDKISPEEQVRKSAQIINKYAPRAIFVEAVFMYTHVFDALRAQFHNVIDVDYIHSKLKGTNVVNKEERIKNICAPSIEQGKVYFLEPTKDFFTKEFIENEYIAFPMGDDDMFDALTLAIHRVVGLRRSDEIPFFFP